MMLASCRQPPAIVQSAALLSRRPDVCQYRRLQHSARLVPRATTRVAVEQQEQELRVFAVSDLHTHHRENHAWVERLPVYQNAILIVAGDISDELEDLRYVQVLVVYSTCPIAFSTLVLCVAVLMAPGKH